MCRRAVNNDLPALQSEDGRKAAQLSQTTQVGLPAMRCSPDAVDEGSDKRRKTEVARQ